MAKRRGPKVVSNWADDARKLVAANLKHYIELKHPGVALNTAFLRVRDKTHISHSTLQRIAERKTGPSIDTLADLAHNLGCELPDFFRPRTDALPAGTDAKGTAPAAQRLQRRRK